MFKKLILPFSLVLTLLSMTTFAQKQTAKGTITDNKGNALEGVTVKALSSKALAASGKNGSFSVNATLNELIEFSFVGFDNKVVKFTGGNLNVILSARHTVIRAIKKQKWKERSLNLK